ncbi:hypothetical protein SAMN06265795_101552 [Noviherbaspirillum humi]|uniref:Uncharacterized protein n=1 Tax=Noviherbaspirillum humi TaxID=1688639 RepID=A0A239CPU7_9BURK|nr:hypothetical protein [Noviherbaspirillum humi]SNS21413.1 hypothetical protein SAMN06265795_101552 [Noviherbaspirillum humi]
MNVKFVIYALMISLVSSVASWQELLKGTPGSASRGGSAWSSSSSTGGYGSSSGGSGHK